ncbi:MAG TPA: DUF4162 domain-containing protein, partial [Candidatus Limnocylindrales bacterium]
AAGDPDLAWLDALPDTAVRRSGRDYHELELLDGQDPQSLLREALARHERITRFEIAEPSIEEIFIEHVGRAATAERTLAEAGEARR